MKPQFECLFAELCGPWLSLSEEQLRLLRAHWELVLLWNQRINLTAIRDTAEAVRRHYGECLFLASSVPAGNWRVLDVGSGAGYPGVPFAIARPECEVSLVESDVRKSVFLREATGDLRNCRVVQRRLEELKEPVPFDWIVSRAVRLEDVAKYGQRLGNGLGLLTTATDSSKLRSSAKGWEWEMDRAIPWQPEHVALLGSKRST